MNSLFSKYHDWYSECSFSFKEKHEDYFVYLNMIRLNKQACMEKC